MRAGAVGVWYPYSASPISNVSASCPCEPSHSCNNEGSVKVAGFDQEGSLPSCNWWPTHKCKRLWAHQSKWNLNGVLKSNDQGFQTKACRLCTWTLNSGNRHFKHIVYSLFKPTVALENKCSYSCQDPRIIDGLIKLRKLSYIRLNPGYRLLTTVSWDLVSVLPPTQLPISWYWSLNSGYLPASSMTPVLSFSSII